MKKLTLILVLLGALIATGADAQAPVAMRVEVEPLEITGETATVRVVIQVSPEDRVRIGRNAIVKIELDGEVPRGQSPMWAVKIQDDGSAEVETVWPPGEHELQVEIESPSGRESGLWVGRVRIQGEVREKAPQPTLAPTPQMSPTPLPVPVPVPESIPGPEPVEEPEPVRAATEESAAEAKSDSGAAVASATGPAAAEKAPPAPAAEQPPPQPTQVAPALASAEPALILAAEAVPAEDDSTPIPIPEPEPEPQTSVAAELPEPMAEETVAAEPPVQAEAQPEEPEPVVIEVLRGEALEESAAGVQAGVEPGPEPEYESSPSVAAASEGWADGATAETVEFTAIVTRHRQPVGGLTPKDLTLKIAGDVVAIEELGDAANAPLLLGAAVDLAPDTAGRWSGAGRQLVPLLARAGEGRGKLFFSASGWEIGSEAGADSLSKVLESPSSGDVAALITASLGQFSGQSSRNFLLLITDGRSDLPKSAWREAVAAAEVSGVPVLVIALWDKDFKQGIRKQLQNIARVSGGRLFLAQGADQLDSVAERYGSMLDAGVAVRFRPPPGMKPASAVSLTAHDKALEVTAPSRLR